MADRDSVGYEIMSGLSGSDFGSLATSMFSGLRKAGTQDPSAEMQQVMLRFREEKFAEDLAREQAAASRATAIAWITVGAGLLSGLGYALYRVLRK